MGKFSRILLILLRKIIWQCLQNSFEGELNSKLKKLQLNFEFNALYCMTIICLTTIILGFFIYSNGTIFRIFG